MSGTDAELPPGDPGPEAGRTTVAGAATGAGVVSGAGAGAGTGGFWSRRFLARLQALGLGSGPDGSGQSPPPRPQVSALTVTAGSVGARVSSSDGHSHDVWVELAVFDARQWARAEQALAEDAEVREALLDGEAPARIEGVLARSGLSLLPARAADLTLECTCPQWSVCGHLTATLAALAAAFDTDPFLLTAWRGRSRERLLRHLAERRAAAAEAGAEPAAPVAERPLAELLQDFWSEGQQHRALRSAAGSGKAGEALTAGEAPRDGAARPDRTGAAPGELGPSGILIRGRALETLLLPAYEALVD